MYVKSFTKQAISTGRAVLRRGLEAGFAVLLVGASLLTGVAPQAYAAGNYELVSGGYTGSPDFASNIAQVSADGRYVLFRSKAQNIVPNDTNQVADQFIYDRQTHATQLVSVNENGDIGNGNTFGAALSADGHHVAIDTKADNLGGTVQFNQDKVYSHDLASGVNTLIATNAIVEGISGDGRYITYVARADNTVHVYDMVTQISVVASADASGAPFAYGAGGSDISNNGRYITFSAAETADDAQHGINSSYLKDLTTGTLTKISPAGVQSWAYELSQANARYVAYITYDGSTSEGPITSLYRKDLTTNQVDLITGPAVGVGAFALSPTGQYVSYTSGGQANDSHVSLWDASTNQTEVICSKPLNSIACLNYKNTISSDGNVVVYNSYPLDDNGAPGDPTLYQVHAYVRQTDTTPPVVTATPDRQPNAAGWYNANVQLTWNAADPAPSSGTPTTPPAVAAGTEGQNVTYGSTLSCDPAGNCASGTASLSIDKTKPTVGSITWSANPKPAGTVQNPVNTTLTVPAADQAGLSGVAGGEYFIGTDPGQGSGTAMTFAGSNLTATFGAGMAQGAYTVSARSRDAAGNWSNLSTSTLVVYNPAFQGVTGRGSRDFVPAYGTDVLPGLTTPGQTDRADYTFTVDWRNGALDPTNNFHFEYNTGRLCFLLPQNCHAFSVDATSFAWLALDQSNSSRARFQGTATMWVDSTTTTNPFTVEAIDGGRRTPATHDQFTLKVYAVGANPATATPLYHVTASLNRATAVRIR